MSYAVNWLRSLWRGLSARAVSQSDDSTPPSAHSMSAQTHSNVSTPRLARRADPVEVAASLPILDTLSRHLRDTASDLQNSVLSISSGFSGMATRARETVQIARDGLHSVDGLSTEETILEIRSVLQSLLSAVLDSSRISAGLSTRLEDLEKILRSVDASLVRVERISEEARIVGLNGRLEAARAGAWGAAFNVVANETKNLGIHASETSSSIRQLVEQLDVSLRSVSTELQSRVAMDADNAQQSQVLVTQLLDQLESMHRGMTHSLQQTESVSQMLTTEIGRSVMALQFQDRVNQRLEHVIEALQALQENLRPFERQSTGVQVAERTADWRRWLDSRSTMNTERAVIGNSEATGTNNGSDGSSDFGSIELF